MKFKLLKQQYSLSPLLRKQNVKMILSISVMCVSGFLVILVLSKRSKMSVVSDRQVSEPYCNLQAAQPQSQILSPEQIDKYMQCSPVTIYFKDTATDGQITSLKEQIAKISGVYYIEYVSQEDAFMRYKKMNKDQPLSMMPEVGLFPRSLIVYVNESSLKKPVVKLVQNSNLVATYTAPYMTTIKSK